MPPYYMWRHPTDNDDSVTIVILVNVHRPRHSRMSFHPIDIRCDTPTAIHSNVRARPHSNTFDYPTSNHWHVHIVTFLDYHSMRHWHRYVHPNHTLLSHGPIVTFPVVHWPMWISVRVWQYWHMFHHPTDTHVPVTTVTISNVHCVPHWHTRMHPTDNRERVTIVGDGDFPSRRHHHRLDYPILRHRHRHYYCTPIAIYASVHSMPQWHILVLYPIHIHFPEPIR